MSLRSAVKACRRTYDSSTKLTGQCFCASRIVSVAGADDTLSGFCDVLLAIAQACVVGGVTAERIGGAGDTVAGASCHRGRSVCECLETSTITEELTREGLPSLEGGGTSSEGTSEEDGGESEAHVGYRYSCKDRKAQVAKKVEELATGVQRRGK